MELSHVDSTGENPKMVDVGNKGVTTRTAHARGYVEFPPEVMKHLKDNGFVTHKGAVLTVAQIAGIMGVKNTSNMIPLCHPLSLTGIDVTLEIEGNRAVIDCTVSCQGKTGVEMEALTGVSVVGLTLYDMCKAMTHELKITDVHLVKKTGGKSDFKTQVGMNTK